jgi:hypothetical protein
MTAEYAAHDKKSTEKRLIESGERKGLRGNVSQSAASAKEEPAPMNELNEMRPVRDCRATIRIALLCLLGPAACYGDIIQNTPTAPPMSSGNPPATGVNIQPQSDPVVMPSAPYPEPTPFPPSSSADAGVADAGETAAACSSPAEISAKILVPKCGTCHGKTAAAAGLDLVSAGAKARLLDVPSRACGTRKLVVTTPAVGGHFFDKLAGSVTGCGVQMPPAGPWLSAVEIQCLKDWIAPPPP